MTKAFDLIDRHRHGPLGAALSAGAALFGITWAILDASGILGGRNTLLALAGVSAVTSVVTYIALLYRRLARLVRADLDAAAQEIRESLEKILARLEPPTADQIRAEMCRYEDLIEDLQDQLRPLTFPLRPVLVDGGKFTVGTDGFSTDEGPPHEVEIDSFLIDPCPVTNQQFQEFITDPDNRDWLPEAVYAKFGIPTFSASSLRDIFRRQVGPPGRMG